MAAKQRHSPNEIARLDYGVEVTLVYNVGRPRQREVLVTKRGRLADVNPDTVMLQTGMGLKDGVHRSRLRYFFIEDETDKGLVRPKGCTCTLDATYWPPTRRHDTGCTVHTKEA